MNDTQGNKTRRRFRLALWIWLTTFGLIVVAMTVIGLVTVVPRRPPYPLMVLLFGAGGATLLLALAWLVYGLRLFARWVCCWRNFRRTLVALASLATLIALFYAEENWRGRRAWEQCKREYEAKGLELNWDAYIPPPVPDDQNMFKAPKMREWFVKTNWQSSAANESPNGVNCDFEREFGVVAELTLLKPGTTPPADVDLVLQYNAPFLTLAASPVVHSSTSKPQPPVKSVIDLDAVLLTNAIHQLARLAELNYSLDPRIAFGQVGPDDKPVAQPIVSLHWTNLTARQALDGLLNYYSLLLIEDPKGGVALITPKQALVAATQDRLSSLIQGVAQARTNVPPGSTLMGTRKVKFIAGAPTPPKPIRVAVLTDTPLIKEDAAQLFRTATTNGLRIGRVEPAGSNSFHALLAPPWISAAEFLAWSEQAESDFNVMREALKRPYARMDGDYERPALLPSPNFVGLRSVAQTLADRAKCHLLLGQPDQALRELTLLQDLRRFLEPPPPGKVTTLVAAMIKVAVAGVYVETLADGFRLNAWREPQLAALQAQLAEVDLLPQVAQAFETEPAATCRMLETATVEDWDEWFSRTRKSWFERVTSPMHLLLSVYPRGWRYQNMAVAARLSLHMQEGVVDLPSRVLSPQRHQKGWEQFLKQLNAGRFSPFYIFANIAIANFVKAQQTTARNQTLANEAQIACALERYRLAHGQYPESLDALVPQLIAKLPHDLINGQPLKYRRTEPPSNSAAAGGGYLLYSIGWNETDDGGQVAKPASDQLEHGDWIWLAPGS